MTDQPTDRGQEPRIVNGYLVPATVTIEELTDVELGKLIGLGQGLELYAKGGEAQANIRREREKYEAELQRRCAEREAEKAELAHLKEQLHLAESDENDLHDLCSRMERRAEAAGARAINAEALGQAQATELAETQQQLRKAEAERDRFRELLADIYPADRADTGFAWLYSGRSERKWIEDRDAALQPQPQEASEGQEAKSDD